MRVLHIDEFDDLFIDNPLGVLINIEPFGVIVASLSVF